MTGIYHPIWRAQAAMVSHQRLKGLCPQITQNDADKEHLFPICVNLRPSAGNSGFNPQPAPMNRDNPQFP
jgi:hypothetical protein